MAICYARLQFVKRSEGKNTAAKAAYNAKIRIEFEGSRVSSPCVYDWTNLGKLEKSISHIVLLPKYVEDSFRDPQLLWNHVERFERRKDSVVGHDFVIGLPDDNIISDEQRIEMAHEFAKKHFVSKGYGVQVDIHPPSQRKSYDAQTIEELEKNERNYHAHFLITARPFREDGKDFSSKKTNDLNVEIRGSARFTFGGIEWPKLWTQFQNEYFEERGLDLRVDQTGIISQKHLGPVRMRGKNSHEILAINEGREEMNQLVSQDSSTILEKLTENKSVFTEQDLEVFLQKNVPENEMESVRNAFWKDPQLVQLFDKGSQQATRKFSSQEVVEEEKRILRLVERIHEKNGFSTKHALIPSNLNEEQSKAFREIINGKAFSCIEGLAGTGKSYLLAALKDHYEANGYRVRAFGPDNATARVLKDKGFKDVSNIHQFLFKNHFSKKKTISSGKEVWIIDESSKVANRPLAELLKSAELNNIQLIFSGNSAQLSSVERGGLFKIVCDRYGYSYLGEVQRQKKEEHREISKRLAHGNVAVAVDMISRGGGFIWSKTKEESLLSTINKWAEDRLHFPYASTLIITHTNNEARQLNDLAHAVRMARGEVSEKEFACQTMSGKIRVSEGDLIEFRSNSKDLKVTNGQRGVLINASEKEFVVATEERKVSFNPQKFNGYQLGYATTNFRSQGGTFDYVYIAYSKNMTKKLLYVAESRHVKNAYCFVPRTEASCLMDIKRQVSRSREIENTIDYTNAQEIDQHQTTQKRENELNELCGSDSLLTKAKGYGFKLLDNLKSSVGSFIEEKRDLSSNKDFYFFPNQSRQAGGHVVEVKDEKLSLNLNNNSSAENSSIKAKEKSQRSKDFSSLSEGHKGLFKNYFEKSENASTLYAIVQSEEASCSVSKQATPSFASWQKACGERNQAASELLKIGSNHKAIVGQKGLDILQDRARRYEDSIRSQESVETKLTENIESLLYKLYPEGPQRRDSRGFRFGSKGSLSVACVGKDKGCFYNFETKEGGNLLDLIEKKIGINKSDAIVWAKNFLNEPQGKNVPSHFSTSNFKNTKDENWISMMPPEGIYKPQLAALSKYLDTHYELASVYTYHSQEGNPVFYTLRLENKEDGKKIVLPLSYGKIHQDEEPTWRLKAHTSKTELLYNTHILDRNRTKPVLVVEGEKTADAAQKLLGKEYVVVTWSGGAFSRKEANWELLFGRDVFIWPDNDSAGFKAADDISSCLRQVGVKSLKVVSCEMLKDLPQKWDLADPLPSDKSPKYISDSLLRAESKAISIDRLSVIASQTGLTFKQLNEVVCNVDDRLRAELEKKHGSKTWEIETAMIAETNKVIQEKHLPPLAKSNISHEKTVQNERSSKSVGLAPSG